MLALGEWGKIVLSNESTSLTVLLLIAIGYSFRVYRMQYGTFLFSPQTASEKVSWIIAGMIMLSLFYKPSNIYLSEECKSLLESVAISTYIIIAIIQSFDVDSTLTCFLISLLKYFSLYFFSVIESIWPRVVLSIVLSFIATVILITQAIEDDNTKIKLAEILFFCIGNAIISIILLCNDALAIILSGIVYIVFEETVLYSVNDIAISAYREHLGLPIVVSE